MNVHTFKDVGKRDSLAHDVDDADDDAPVARMKGNVDGEEEGDTKFNDIGEVMEPFNLKEERENGYYDDGGNYVSRDEHKEVDAWVADLDEATMVNSYVIPMWSQTLVICSVWMLSCVGKGNRRIRTCPTEEATKGGSGARRRAEKAGPASV